MKVILGTGQLGHTILKELLNENENEEIVIINRSGKINFHIPTNVQLISCDVTNKHEMEFIAREAEVIFSCTDVPYEKWSDFYPKMAAALFYALKQTNTKLVYADNMYSYGNLNGNEFIETLENKALTKKGIIRSRVIHTLLHDDPAINKKVAIVKAADFIGNGIHKGIFSSDFIDRLYNNKTISLYGNLHLPHSFTNINDFAKAMINISQSDDSFGQVWHAPNSTTLSISEWITLFELETGRKANIRSVPKVIIFLLGIVNKSIKELYELGYQFEYPYSVNNKKYTDKFGMHFTANTQSVKQTVDHYWKNKSK